jgi:hypothetical protein
MKEERFMGPGNDRPLRHAPATLRNREPILEVLRRVLPREGLLLEIASGSGEHAAFIAPKLPGNLEWQPSETDINTLPDIDARAADCSRIRKAVLLNAGDSDWPVASAAAVFCCNMIHIAPWQAAEGLFAGASRILAKDAPFILYGPFKRNGAHTAPSNAAFDENLRARDSSWGVRCLDTDVVPLAERSGFVRDEVVEMPANNLTVIFRRT